MDEPHDDRVDHLLRLISRFERLEALPRTGWIVCGVQHPESIAAHSYMVTVIALWIADHIDEPVDIELMLRAALVHDAGESMLTDLPKPVKQLLGQDDLHHAEQRAAHTILADSDPQWRDAYDLYLERESIEAQIIKAADTIQMLAKACQYQAQGRGDVRRFFDNQPRTHPIPLVERVFERLHRYFLDHDWFPAHFD